MGLMEDKVVKNHFASEYIYNKYKDERTCGILEEDKEYGTLTIAEPVGLICAIVPTTNPTNALPPVRREPAMMVSSRRMWVTGSTWNLVIGEAMSYVGQPVPPARMMKIRPMTKIGTA